MKVAKYEFAKYENNSKDLYEIDKAITIFFPVTWEQGPVEG